MSCHSASVRSEVYRIRSVLRECIYIVQTKIADFIDAFWVFKQALTILRIPDAIPDSALRSLVALLVDDAEQKTRFAREWRNRRLAHHELPEFQGQVAAPLPAAGRQDVEDALAAI